MLKNFQKNISDKNLFNQNHRLLLALSGGVDSVVLSHLLNQSKFHFSIAHCNFKLRKIDSDRDELFCKELAKKLKVEFYSKSFDVKKRCEEKKISVQMAARELRYEWFEELLKEKKFDYLLTAHHRVDLTETVLLNLLKGSGIKGLKGIQEKRGHVVRPLLIFSKKEIQDFAKQKKIKFRFDKSNSEDKYQRNFLRLKVIPLLKKINPSVEETFYKNAIHFAEENEILESYLDSRIKNISQNENGCISIPKNKLNKEKFLPSLIHRLIKPFGFNSSQEKDLQKILESEFHSVKKFVSKTHTIYIDHQNISIRKNTSFQPIEIKFSSFEEMKSNFEITSPKEFSIPNKNEFIIEKHKLIFPLVWRNTLTIDKFQPLGMKGKKLLSRFLKDENISADERKRKMVLVNGNSDILWVDGLRSNERYRVNPENHLQLIKLKLIGAK